MNIQSSHSRDAEGGGESVEELIIRMSTLSVERLPMLETIFGRFCVALPPVLDGYSGADTEASLEAVSYKPCREALAALPSPSFIAVSRVRPGGKPVLVSFESELLITALEIMLGARGARRKQWSPRDFTAIEKKLGARLCETILGELAAHFAELGDIGFAVDQLESSLEAATLLMPVEGPAAHVEMTVTFNGNGGRLAFVIPHGSLEPFLPGLAKTSLRANPEADTSWRGLLSEKLQETTVDLTTLLHSLSVPMTEVLSWASGKTLDLGIDSDHEVTLLCSGVPMFRAAMGRRKNGSVALRVTEELKAKDRLNDDGTVD